MMSARLIAITTRRPAPKPTSRSNASSVSQNEVARRSHEATVTANARRASLVRGLSGLHRPGLPAGKDEDRGERERDEDDGEDRRAPQPGDVRQERRGGKEEDEEREDVVDPLADGGCERLGARGAGCLVEREDADRLARSRRQDVVEEVADEERARGRADRGARSRREEQAPAQRANEDGQREDGQGRHEPGRVALPQPVPEDVEVDRTDRKVGKDERDDEPDDREQRA